MRCCFVLVFAIVGTPVTHAAAAEGWEVAGVNVGAKVDALKAKCKAPGWTCKEALRTVRAGGKKERVERFVATFAESMRLPYGRARFVARGGKVIAIFAYLRQAEPKEFERLVKSLIDDLTKRFGEPRNDPNGRLAWVSKDRSVGVRLTSGRGTLDLFAFGAGAKTDLLAKVPIERREKRTERSTGVGGPSSPPTGAKPAKGSPPPPPRVISMSRLQEAIPVKLILDKLECVKENDYTSVFHGDDPYLYTFGLHTASPAPWYGPKKSWSDIEEDKGSRWQKIGVTVFDGPRDVRVGESVGFHLSLWEGDNVSDDEIDFVTRTYRFEELYPLQGKVILGRDTFVGDGAVYVVHYRVEVGRAKKGTAPADTVFGKVNARKWAGEYDVVLDGHRATAVFEAARDDAGFLGGGGWTGSDGKRSAIMINRQAGAYVDFAVSGLDAGEPQRFFGYLIGDQKKPAIAGTTWHGGLSFGFYMVRKGGAK